MRQCLILIASLLFLPTPLSAQEYYHLDAPKSPVLLHGKAEKKHHAKSNNDFQREEPKSDNQIYKNANAAMNALEAEDQELLIEWDKWRNKISKKVWLKLNEHLTGGICFNLGGILLSTGEGSSYNFRKGIEVTYICDITKDRHIAHLQVTHPSGDPTYDNLVLACVRSLEGKKYLQFPEGSARTRVRTSATLKIGHALFRETKYNDREFVKVPSATD